MNTEVTDFLRESNAIERVYNEGSLYDAQKAWMYLSGQKKLTPEIVKFTHSILMEKQGLKTTEIGKYRNIPVYIGGKEAIDAPKIPFMIEEWIERMNENCCSKHPQDKCFQEERTKTLHVLYEKIHPFIDGNGRTSRMFMNWWRVKNGLPILVIHEGVEQMDYYKWFK